MRKLVLMAYTTAALMVLAVFTPPVANAYRSCDEARAAGAAPLYAGQPGYSRDLDSDGDGVACETGGGSGGIRVPSVPLPVPPVPVPAPPTGSNISSGPAAIASGGYTTVVHWSGADCIEITAPDGTTGGVLKTGSYCGGATQFAIIPTSGDQMVGADPIIGSASSASCEILTNRLTDAGTAGDGHDINCLTRADALK